MSYFTLGALIVLGAFAARPIIALAYAAVLLVGEWLNRGWPRKAGA